MDERRGTMVRKFEVEIEDAARNTTFAVIVDGQQVATLVTDSSGEAKLKYSTSPRDGRETMMPSDSPSISEGSTITINELRSAFRRTFS